MDEKPTEGNPEAGGDEAANPQSSQSQGQPSEDSLASTVRKLQAKIEAQEGEIRALKSGKDKGIDRAQRLQQDTISQLARYLNVSEDQVREAQRQSVLDDLVKERISGPEPAPESRGRDNGQGVQAGQYPTSEAIAYVERYNLPTNDPEFIALLRTNPTEDMIKDYVLGRMTPQKPASPSNVVQSPVRNSGPGQKTPNQLEADYQRDMKAIIDSTIPGDPSRLRRITALKAQYNALGLNKT